MQPSDMCGDPWVCWLSLAKTPGWKKCLKFIGILRLSLDFCRSVGFDFYRIFNKSTSQCQYESLVTSNTVMEKGKVKIVIFFVILLESFRIIRFVVRRKK